MNESTQTWYEYENATSALTINYTMRPTTTTTGETGELHSYQYNMERVNKSISGALK